jgi:hypothetical protein
MVKNYKMDILNKGILWIKLSCIILVATTISACHKDSIFINLPVFGPTQAFYALSESNTLTLYNAKDVRNAGSRINISGLASGETILSIDFRPATGELYGVSSSSKLYVIDATTGAAKAISITSFTPALNGTTVSINFNPTDDLLRIITSSGQNLRLNPETGQMVATDANVSSNTISGIAYTNSTAGATSTILYSLDPFARKLYRQEPANSGTLVTVGNVELSLGDHASLDISPDNTKALIVGKVGDSTKLFTINLTSGKATIAGKFTLGTSVRSIAIPTSPVAYAVDNVNNLFIFDPTLATSTMVSKALTGLQTGEKIHGIDMRPLNGQLYALGSSNRLYTINVGSGICTQIGTGAFTTALSGTSFGFDFNPFTDQIRVVSDTRQNLSINPNTGVVTVEPNVTSTTATLSAAAYNNNSRSSSTTTLFVIDHTTDKLYNLVPTTGVLTEVGELKVNVSTTNGFDIGPGNIGYGIFTVAGKNNLYLVDLGSGLATVGRELSQTITAFTLGLRF